MAEVFVVEQLCRWEVCHWPTFCCPISHIPCQYCITGWIVLLVASWLIEWNLSLMADIQACSCDKQSVASHQGFCHLLQGCRANLRSCLQWYSQHVILTCSLYLSLSTTQWWKWSSSSPRMPHCFLCTRNSGQLTTVTTTLSARNSSWFRWLVLPVLLIMNSLHLRYVK